MVRGKQTDQFAVALPSFCQLFQLTCFPLAVTVEEAVALCL